MKPPHPTPRAFLKARRPERFSDSISTERVSLDRSALEYHLDTLTNRGQENDFESFARMLCEREVCPNLLPHTGPTGGGDSKVDAETYPVADALSLIWVAGVGSSADSERWGFAFSAKKEWRSKVKGDVAKLVKTGRGYSKAFFVSSRFVPDRARAEVEDGLRKEHGLDVRIFDRTWILDRVFAGHHEQLCVDELRLSVPPIRETQTGPMDVGRKRELAAVEDRLKASTVKDHGGFQLVEDCLESALLARALDRPRTDVEGRFERAKNVAKRYGTPRQRLQVAYDRAWTAYWWFEDFQQFDDLYDSLERFAKGSSNPREIELLVNAWMLQHALHASGVIPSGKGVAARRLLRIYEEVDRLAGESERPSCALQARTMRRLIDFGVATSQGKSLEPIVADLRGVLSEGESLLGFPLRVVTDLVVELADLFTNEPSFEQLFDLVVELISRRSGEVTGARMLLKRAAVQLDADKPYEAIRTLGRAMRHLAKHESRRELVWALYLCGSAYERVGLFWAARGTFLNAASMASADFMEDGRITVPQAGCFAQVKWAELRLGRLPQALAWQELTDSISSILDTRGDGTPDRQTDRRLFDAILGILLLKTDILGLARVTRLPETLLGLGLPCSGVALLYALGHVDEAVAAVAESEGQDVDGSAFFIRWRDQPASGQLPDQPELGEGATVLMHSHLLGCHIIVETENTPACLALGESFLAALESLLATGLADRMMALEPTLRVAVTSNGILPFSLQSKAYEDHGRPRIELTCGRFEPHNLDPVGQDVLKNGLLEAIFLATARAFSMANMEDTLTRLIRDERVIERALNFTSSPVVTENVMGAHPRTRISDWLDDTATEFPLKRSERWDTASPKPPSPRPVGPLMAGDGEPPEALTLAAASHEDIRTVSLVRAPLWDKAGWKGVAYLHHPDPRETSLMAFMFEDRAAASAIFAGWRAELGAVDEREQLRISIIRGVSVKHPHSYRVVVGSNVDHAFAQARGQFVVMASRINTMHPTTDDNLELFRRRHEHLGRYFLTFVELRPDGTAVPNFEYCIGKSELFVRDAWQVGRNDPDAVAIQPGDDVVIPSGELNPPVRELLSWKARSRDR